jgi:hypothetical protein
MPIATGHPLEHLTLLVGNSVADKRLSLNSFYFDAVLLEGHLAVRLVFSCSRPPENLSTNEYRKKAYYARVNEHYRPLHTAFY